MKGVGTVLAILVLLGGTALPRLRAQGETGRVAEIRFRRASLAGSDVIVGGRVTQSMEATAETVAHYFLADGLGQAIRVQSAEPGPRVGQQLRVLGRVALDVVTGEPLLVEIYRAGTNERWRPPPPAPTPLEASNRHLLAGAVAAQALVLIAVLGLVAVMARRRSRPASTAATRRPNASQDDLVLLPGRFVRIGDGAAGADVRFFHPVGAVVSETTFGRAPATGASHVQLSLPTVAARQARVVFAHGRRTLINTAQTNPTMVNGQPLAVGGARVLEDGDEVRMGEVVFRYQAQAALQPGDEGR